MLIRHLTSLVRWALTPTFRFVPAPSRHNRTAGGSGWHLAIAFGENNG